MDGSPCFLEPLVNVTIKEGSKFRIACSIAGFPQPKVIWYHNKGKVFSAWKSTYTEYLFVSVPLKNGEDYQYKVNGTIYSLNMDECFREDEGIYTIRSVIPLRCNQNHFHLSFLYFFNFEFSNVKSLISSDGYINVGEGYTLPTELTMSEISL